MYTKKSAGGFGSTKNLKDLFRRCSPSDGCPKPTVRPKLPVQGQLDVPRCPRPPVQGHLDVQRCPKPPVQGQLDVQKLPKTTGPEPTSVQSAEPLFLLAGAVLSRVRRLCGRTENRLKSTNNCSADVVRTSGVQKLRFFSPVQGQLVVQRCSKRSVQRQLDLQRCPKLPVQGQLDAGR